MLHHFLSLSVTEVITHHLTHFCKILFTSRTTTVGMKWSHLLLLLQLKKGIKRLFSPAEPDNQYLPPSAQLQQEGYLQKHLDALRFPWDWHPALRMEITGALCSVTCVGRGSAQSLTEHLYHRCQGTTKRTFCKEHILPLPASG